MKEFWLEIGKGMTRIREQVKARRLEFRTRFEPISTWKETILDGFLHLISTLLVLQFVSGFLLSFGYVPSTKIQVSQDGSQALALQALRTVLDYDGDTLYVRGSTCLVTGAELKDSLSIFHDSTNFRPIAGGTGMASEAFNSIHIGILHSEAGGVFMAELHHWCAQALMFVVYAFAVVMIVLKLYSNTFTPGWTRSISIVILISTGALLGSLLSWDSRAQQVWRMLHHLLSEYVPIVGTIWVSLLESTSSVIDTRLQRLFLIHAFVIPATLVLMLNASYRNVKTLTHGTSNSGVSNSRFFLTRGVAVVMILLAGMSTMNMGPTVQHSLNANGLAPEQIQPEWYFQPVYVLLHNLPEDLVVVGVMGAIVGVYLLPLFTKKRSPKS